MARVRITDLALRDGHQSLLATRMTLADMLPAAADLDQVGYWSLETWGGATFDTCIRFLNEDPWERIRALKKAMPHTPMQMLLRGQNLVGYRNYADDVVEAFVGLAAANGVDVFRIFDALNDPRNLRTSIRAVKHAGKHAQATLSYATTPWHTPDTYVALARELESMGADSLCVKDMAGLLKPNAAFDLVRALKQAVRLPIHVHSHATTGMSVATLLKAVEAGADLLDTTISALAMGTSHSPTETLVEILRDTPYDTGLDLGRLVRIAAHFREVRKRYRQFESSFLGADTRILIAQVPGGMLSNLESQLREQNALDKLDAVLGEIATVQKDFGYPPLVTPTSQIVGTQALLNVLFGHYKRLTAESRNLLVGNYGATPAPANPELVRQALAELKMEAPVTVRPADNLPNELAGIEQELKTKLGAASVSREDVLTYAMFPQVALAFFQTRVKGPVVFAPPPDKPAKAAAAAPAGPARFTVNVDGRDYDVTHEPGRDGAAVTVDGTTFRLAVRPRDAEAGAAAPTPAAATADAPLETVEAPMPGTILKLARPEGSPVAAGETLLIMEALKMEMEIKTAKAGRVHYRVAPGETVKAGAALADVR